MNFWAFLFLLIVFGWIGFGRLVDSDTHGGRLARAFLAGIFVRLTGKPVAPEKPTDGEGGDDRAA
jgi:hypothetical protein